MTHEPFLSLSPERYALSDPLSRDIHLLDSLLGERLAQQEGEELLQLARRLFAEDAAENPLTLLQRMPQLQDPRIAQQLLRAFTVLFQLLNTAEQKEIVRINRTRRAQAGSAPGPESIAEAILRLKQSGQSAGDMQRLLDHLDICPTLTAHPTEARRRAVLNKLQNVAEWLVEAVQPTDIARLDVPLDSAGRAERGLRRTLEALWQTDELRSSPLTVSDETRNALYFFEHTIFDVVACLHDDLRRALQHSYPGHPFRIPPFLRYHSWVGGDRDGNPNVTPDVTWETLIHHKRLILQHYLRCVENLRREFTQSARLFPPGEELLASLRRDAGEIDLGADWMRLRAAEPCGLKLLYVGTRLQAALAHLDVLNDFRAEGASFAAQPPAYLGATAFLDDLRLLQRACRENHAGLLADEGALAGLIAQAETFGFHLASLDVRQHSGEHERAVEAMIAEAGLLPQGVRYRTLGEAEKARLLTRELCSPRPLLPREGSSDRQTQALLEVFDVIRHAQRYLAAEAVTSYVISMTHGVSDVLEALLLAKEAGLLRWRMRDGQPVLESDLEVVPLFETIEDLNNCDALMRALFANRAYRLHLQARGGFQEIMLGYSDSSKDGGYLAASWALHDTQARLARTCEKAGIALRLFHGRGGTVGRGGGRASRAIISQPAGSFNGRIRFTEQGEIVSFRYSLLPIAHRHLEQIVHASLLAAGDRSVRQRRRLRPWHDAMERMAEKSREVYRALVYDPDFWKFYTQATPIAHISRLPIASRPVFRPGRPLVGIEDLRTIPWVFAWVQSRYVLPGWYGLGSALEWFAGEAPENLLLLQQMYVRWPFFRTMIDNAQLELVRAHLPTAAWHAARVRPKALATRLHYEIEVEHGRTLEGVLRLTGQAELMERERVVRRTVEFRNPAAATLSKLQVALLEFWDRQEAQGNEPEPAWRDAILLSIAGIAAAMQSTG